MAEDFINNFRITWQFEDSDISQSDDMNVSTNHVGHMEASEISRNQFAFADNESTYKDDSLMGQLFNMKFSKTLLIIFPVCLITFVIGFASITYITNKSHPSSEPNARTSLNLQGSILISSGNKIYALDIDSKHCEPVISAHNEILALDPHLGKTIFWNEANVSSINTMYSGQPNLTYTSRLQTQAIAVDYLTDKVYFVDKPSGSLAVLDMREKHFGILYADLEEPHDLVLDPPEGLMFIVQYHKSILKVNMDGSHLRSIVESSRVSSLAIDRKASRLFWTNDGSSIESGDYEGLSRQTVLPIPLNVASLTFAEGRLYWTRVSGWSEFCPCSNVLWSCSLYRRSCNNASALQLPFSSPRIVRGPAPQQREQYQNGPCAHSNGNCSHLCLMTSRGSHSCGCALGWRLHSDGRTCLPASKILFYLQGDYVRARVLGIGRDEPFAPALIPTRFRVEPLKKSSVHFDYDPVTGEIYFSDDHNIYRLNLLRDDEQSRLLEAPSGYVINDVVYDWAKESLLYVRQATEPANNHSIIALRLRSTQQAGKARNVLLSTKFKKEPHIDCYSDLAIQPDHEYLFFSDYNGVADNLRRISTNGKGMILWKPFYSNVQLNFVTIDQDRNRIYWATTNSPNLIKSANFEGSEEESLGVVGVTNIIYAAVADLLYLGNASDVLAVKKDSGTELTRLVKRRYRSEDYRTNAYEHLHGIRVYSLVSRNG